MEVTIPSDSGLHVPSAHPLLHLLVFRLRPLLAQIASPQSRLLRHRHEHRNERICAEECYRRRHKCDNQGFDVLT